MNPPVGNPLFKDYGAALYDPPVDTAAVAKLYLLPRARGAGVKALVKALAMDLDS